MVRNKITYLLVVGVLLFGFAVNADEVPVQIDSEQVTLPDARMYQIDQSGGETLHYHTYYKDGGVYIYFEETDELLTVDLDTFSFIPKMFDVDSLLENYEIRELGITQIAGRKAAHIQIINKRTGIIISETWADEETGFPLQTISYDSEGKEQSKMTVLELDLSPDFSDIDFSAARVFGLPSYTTLTEAEFQELVPWYDVAKRPSEDFELAAFSSVGTEGSEVAILQVFYTDGMRTIIVQISGQWDAIQQGHGPSDFNPIRSYVLPVAGGPGIRSRKGVMVSMLGEEDSSELQAFLNSLILHPTEQ